MVRKSGMVIWPKQFRSAVPYCGVFLCRNDEATPSSGRWSRQSTISGTPTFPRRA